MAGNKRGPKRKFNPDIPSHIDQSGLPAGLYWHNTGDGRWRVAEAAPDGTRTFVTVAGRAAKLSDLIAIMEQRAGKAARGTVRYVSDAFMESTEWKALSADTHRDYTIHAEVACGTPTRTGKFGDLNVDRLTPPVIQTLIESITAGKPESRPGAGDAVKGRPSTANHVLRYLRRLFAWGMRSGECRTNPAAGCRQSKERKRNTMPVDAAFVTVLNFARQRGARASRTAGACPAYIAPAMNLAFRLRMRISEVVSLSEADAIFTPLDDAPEGGVVVERVKGSRDNIVRWTPELRAAWDEALAARKRTMSTKRNAGRPTPLRPEHRPIFVDRDGGRLSKGALGQAVQDLMALAISEGVIAAEDRFSMHGLKHKGITKTKGNRADKQQASGHKTAAMMDTYDHEMPVVAPATMPGLDGELCSELCNTKESGT